MAKQGDQVGQGRHLYQDATLSTGFLELSLIFSGVNALLSGQFIVRRSNSTLTGIR
jgi:hypothetical protein